MQNIVTALREKQGTHYERFEEVGHLRRDQRPFKVIRPKISKDHSEVLREGADDLTLRAEEVDTQKACINVDHIDENVGERRWCMQIGTPFAKQFMKELKEVSGKSCVIIAEM